MSVRVSWIDIKLGVRMLKKHPALTLLGGLGLAVGIAISVGFFSFTAAYVYPEVPLEEGDRIVALENRDIEVNNEERQSLHDFFTWRDELTSVEELGAFRRINRNLITGDGQPQLVPVAEMTAAGFRVARVPPLRGRYLLDEDERVGAEPVLVIGYSVWQDRFAADPEIIGREVRLDDVPHTIVGVMPDGFAFPESHSYWTALRAQPSQYERRAGPEIFVFGRLAPRATLETAQAELSTIGERTAAEFPETHEQLRPMVMPYVHSLGDIQGITFGSVFAMNAMMGLVLLVVAFNVAVLIYARTAARHGEIAVRNALGASRARVVAQIFAESLVLSLVAAAAGLALAQIGLDLGQGIIELEYDVGVPFWTDYSLRPAAVAFTLGLALLTAVLTGALPALQATGRRLQSDLRQLGGGSMRLGRTWTVLIVAQVAIAVAALPAAVNIGWTEIRAAATRSTFAAEEFVVASVVPLAGAAGDADAEPGATAVEDRFGMQLTELLHRIEAEPGVVGAAFRARLPGREGLVRIEDVAPPTESPAGHPIDAIGVSPGYNDLLGLRMVSGRSLASADAGPGATGVVVTQAFVRQVLGGGAAIGRRIRHVSEAERAGEAVPPRWFQIVGVMQDLETNRLAPELVDPQVYYSVSPEQVRAASLTIRLRGSDVADFAGRLRVITTGIDPTLRLGTVFSLADSNRQRRLAARLVGLAVGLVLLTVLLLAAAGIYAMMSFIVTQRRREIGIRAALGGQPRQVLRSVFSRAAGQVALGLLLGIAAGAVLEQLSRGALVSGRGAVLFPALAVLVAGVGLLAALGPARRGLRVDVVEALRGGG